MSQEKELSRMILGGCAVAVFAMLSAVTAQFESAPTDQAAGVYVGVTAATKGPTVPPHRPPIPFAKPAITGPAKLPPEEQGLPGD